MSKSSRLQPVNNIGLRFSGAADENLQTFGVWMDGSSLQVWVSVRGIDVMQCLTPGEAMAFAKAFERCAIAALKEQA